MVKSRFRVTDRTGQKKTYRKRKLVSMGRASTDIINEMYHPLDAVNRFINLALQITDDDSQNRQFLLESKSGVRKMLGLVKKLNDCSRQMEKEIKKNFKNYKNYKR